MSRALAVHDDALATAIRAAGGTVFKHTGDGMCAVFEEAESALLAAVDGQRRLRDAPLGDAPLRVRMAAHTGDAEQRGEDFFGPALNRVARLMSAGHGGQVLCTHVTAELVADVLPAGVELRDLGTHRLRDLDRPEQVFQVIGEGLREEFPPLRTLSTARHNLPVVPSTFVGREAELRALAELIRSQALVTLVGAGGAGKTRLALELAARVVEHFSDGAYFVDLGVVGDRDGVPGAAASALGISGTGSTVRHAVVNALSSQRLLLVLDNCEHVIDACADLAEEILATCPDVRLLATSRERLGVDGEQAWHVGPLATSPADDGALPHAVALFTARATAVRPDFVLAPEGVDVARDLCERLDGLPLAIELAAARVSHMSVAQIAERLDDRFRLLTGSRRRVDRHQTLRTTVSWSVDLLEEPERRLLRRLGVFAGPFTLAAVEGACLDDDDRWQALDLLGSLVEKSLVVSDLDRDPPRYRLLETVRAFAWEDLVQQGESEEARLRQRAWFLDLVQSDVGLLLGESAAREIEPLLPSIHAAIEWSIEREEYLEGARLVVGTWSERIVFPSLADTVRLGLALLDHPDALPGDLRAVLRAYVAIALLWTAKAAEARQLIRESLDSDQAHPISWAVLAMIEVGMARDPGSRERIAPMIDAAMDGLAGGAYDTVWGSYVRCNVAFALQNAGCAQEARDFARAALEGVDEDEFPAVSALARVTAGVAAHLVGLRDESHEVVAPVVRMLQAPGASEDLVAFHGPGLAVVSWDQGDRRAAVALLRHLVEIARRHGLPLGHGDCLVALAGLAALEGMWEDAARLTGAAAAQPGVHRFGFRTPNANALYLHNRERARDVLGDETAHRLRDEGKAMWTGDALAMGFALVDDDPSA